MKTGQQAVIAFVMGIFTLLAVFVSHLALTDIYRGEGDLGLEWNILRVCFAAVVAFQVFTLATLLRVVRGSADKEKNMNCCGRNKLP
jgi:adenylosuccinate lyase